MTQSPNSVEGKIHYQQSAICLTFSLPSLIVKYYKASFTHYNLVIIQRKQKLSPQYYIKHQKFPPSQTHSVEKEICPCSASHSLSRKWTNFHKIPSLSEVQSLQSGRRKNSPTVSFVSSFNLFFHMTFQFHNWFLKLILLLALMLYKH